MGSGNTKASTDGVREAFRKATEPGYRKRDCRYWDSRLRIRKARIAEFEAELEQRKKTVAAWEAILKKRKVRASAWEADLKAQKKARTDKTVKKSLN
jgi:hypothetical protein